MTDNTARHAQNQRAQHLLSQMTLDEKLAQIVGFWDKGDGEAVAPLQGEFEGPTTFTAATTRGLGHLTRVYGTRPVDPAERAAWLWNEQRRIVRETRLGIPMLVHEECLTGLSAWQAATFPTPLAWGASFNAPLVQRMGALIGESMRQLGIHQGLAPVLDVVRDPRWGRVEECIAEDPYTVGTIGTAYVQGLQSQGIHATLKHFVGYSASQSGRNFGPVHAGPREIADVLLPPFEMAIRDGGVRSVMHAYTEIDGIPVAANPHYLTDLLRDQWGFDGVVVADYFGVAFLNRLHHTASSLEDAAHQALTAGVDIELPTGDAYLAPLRQGIVEGRIDEALVDRAVLRALTQKAELGLLDETFDEEPPTNITLDSAEHRAVARQLAEESVVLLSNSGVLPLTHTPQRLAVIGPNADRISAMFGCYSFVNHVLSIQEGYDTGIEVPTLHDALATEFPGATISHTPGCGIEDDDTSGFAEATALAGDSDLTVLVLGDQAGLFGRGTVGEGCDRDSLELPGVQRQLAEAVLATGKPVIIVLLTGRPYVVGWALEQAGAVVQAFFPGEEGAAAVTGVLSGRINPSGRLPVSLPRSTGAQPYTYLHPRLGGDSDVTNLSTQPVRPFGFGLSYTTFEHSTPNVAGTTPKDGLTVTVDVTNTGDKTGQEVVHLYARDVIGSVTRPVAQLIGFTRVELHPGQQATVTFTVPPTLLSFTNAAMQRIVEPGEFHLWTGNSAQPARQHTSITLVGEPHTVQSSDALTTTIHTTVHEAELASQL
ncbi:glycoside hydrolase family 3 N-terminal domain-containing protein [Jonesia quinghaiensis]|uniref:beta-xylosidase/alpha-l-arabinosidase n=1 Tax=Jonesia quinghaiensis TaxID=262806 RepID=UPI000429436B|nr:glycoside hydrolase family 3 N-terminal domain-containing protein [Jonesia quinghaiensis]